MRKIWFFILSSFLLLWGCVAPAPAEEPPPSNSELIWEYIDTRLPDSLVDWPCDYYVTDSIYIKSLQTTLYKVNPGFADANEYVLLLDEQNGQIYPIIFHHWSRYNRPLLGDLNLRILENDQHGYNIEPIDYSFLELEIFLNRCVALQFAPLNYEAMDTIFQFYFEERHARIMSSAALDSMALTKDHRNESFKLAYLKKIELFKQKVQEEGVFLYYNGFFWEYFEIDNASEQIGHSAEDGKRSLFDHWYNLKALQL